MPASSASQWARSSRRRNAGPDSSRWNHSARLRPVTTGMRAMRLVCRFGEWVSDNWHLHGESALDLSVPHRRPPDHPPVATNCSATAPEAHHHDRRRPVVERAAVPRGDRAVRAEYRLERGDLLYRGAGPGTVVGTDHGAVRQGDGGDLALPETIGDGLLGQVLRAHPELVLLLARDAAQLGHVLRGLAHRDVEVGYVPVLARVVPGPRPFDLAGRGPLGTLPRFGEGLVVRVGPGIAAALGEPAHALDPGRDVHVPFAGLDRVEGHPGGLQRRGAVPVHGSARNMVMAEQYGDHARHVEALLAAGQPAAEDQVADVGRVELRHLGQRR